MMFGAWYFVIAIAVPTIALIVCTIIKVVNYDFFEFYLVTAILSTFLTVVLVVISICLPLKAKKEIREFEYQKQIVEESVENGTQIENIAITQTIIEKTSGYPRQKPTLKHMVVFQNITI